MFKEYTREEKLKIIKYIVNNDASVFDDMFEVAEGSNLLKQCQCCYKYYVPKDMVDDDPELCKSCHSSIDQWYEDEIVYKEGYEHLVRGK